MCITNKISFLGAEDKISPIWSRRLLVCILIKKMVKEFIYVIEPFVVSFYPHSYVKFIRNYPQYFFFLLNCLPFNSFPSAFPFLACWSLWTLRKWIQLRYLVNFCLDIMLWKESRCRIVSHFDCAIQKIWECSILMDRDTYIIYLASLNLIYPL